MLLTDYSFELPEELIAQEPLAERSASRLLVVDRADATIRHTAFSELPRLLQPGDLLIRNETRVIPARLHGVKASGGRIEVLLIERLAGADELWRCLTRSAKPARVGQRLTFADGVSAEVVADLGEGSRTLCFYCTGDFATHLENLGEMPLPPYIQRAPRGEDRERYQTVFARESGAVAAPTAGLHFIAGTFADLEQRGIEVRGVTLHVGPGTFQPVRAQYLDDHRMHGEAYTIPAETAEAVNRARREGRRVVALGTTSTRALESAVDAQGQLLAGSGVTELFIRPGFNFRVTGALITNFHLPQSTLLVLVATFAGKELIFEAYRQAVAERYRFFSYGDCMLIL